MDKILLGISLVLIVFTASVPVASEVYLDYLKRRGKL